MAPSGLQIEIQRDGAVVRTRHFRVNLGGRHLVYKTTAHKEVVYPPADVPVAGTCKVAPPRVVSAAFRKQTECIYKSGTDNGINPSPPFFGESVPAFIGLWIGQVIGSMRHIEVAAENNGLFLL